MAAREAVQTAEDARAITVKRQEEERLADERKAGANREALAKAETEAEGRLRMQAESERRMESDRRARAEVETVNAQSETARISQEADAARVASQIETDRVKRENDMARDAAQNEAERTALAATQEADRLRLKGEAEKAELRSQLLSQFNLILDTRDTARGLIINMSDVLFDTSKFSLRPLARERLAKVAGILLGHPGLKLEVEGHTDSVGGEQYNQRLSEQRAGSVRELGSRQRVRQVAACSDKRYSRGTTAQSARGTHCLRRTHWYAGLCCIWVAVSRADNYLGLHMPTSLPDEDWGQGAPCPQPKRRLEQAIFSEQFLHAPLAHPSA
jgi:outer membrane protein OmpA-like peptidoglycan-associated protein